jgi:hypothetical protein
MTSIYVFNLLPAALRPWSWLSLEQNFLGGSKALLESKAESITAICELLSRKRITTLQASTSCIKGSFI